MKLLIFLLFASFLYAQNYRDSSITFENIPWGCTPQHADSIFKVIHANNNCNQNIISNFYAGGFLNYKGGCWNSCSVVNWYFADWGDSLCSILIYFASYEDSARIMQNLVGKYGTKNMHINRGINLITVIWTFANARILLKFDSFKSKEGDPILIYENKCLADKFKEAWPTAY